MPELPAELHVVARVRVIPGAVTLAERAVRGEYWCTCHGFHHHDALQCPSERRPEEG